MKLCHVKWRDACFMGGDVRSPNNLGGLIDVDSAGVYVGEDDEMVSIASDFYADDDAYRYVFHIPKVNILELRVFSVDGLSKRRVRR